MNNAINAIADQFANYFLGRRVSGIKRKSNTYLIKQVIEFLNENRNILDKDNRK